MSSGYTSPEPWDLSDEDTGIVHGGEGVEQRPLSPDTDNNSVIDETPSPSEPHEKPETVMLCPVTVCEQAAGYAKI